MGADSLREGIIIDLGVKHELKWRKLGPFGLGGMSKELDHPLVFEEIIVFPGVVESIRLLADPAVC